VDLDDSKIILIRQPTDQRSIISKKEVKIPPPLLILKLCIVLLCSFKGTMHTPNKILDDHPLILSGISELISSHFPHAEIVECTTGNEFIRKSLNEEPDLLIADLLPPDVSGTYAVCKIKQNLPKVKVIFLSAFTDFNIEEKCFNVGGDLLLSKENASTELINQIKKLFNSPTVDLAPQDLNNRLLLRNKLCDTTTKLLGFEFEVFDAKLTRQQKKIFTSIGEGKERKEIVNVFNISSKTYDKHLENIKHCLNLNNSHELIMLAINYRNYLGQVNTKQKTWYL
jgi:two-component system nitrate/nitrite response regulator NarL